MSEQHIGVITEGSTLEGCIGRLGNDRSVESVRVGQFVTIRGEQAQYFSMLTDIRLATTTPDVLIDPPATALLRAATRGTTTYGQVKVKPMLMLSESDSVPRSVKSVPSHFSPILEATDQDFKTVFGVEDAEHFAIGTPLEADVAICLNLSRFIERSNGIFGKSGTGKSFLTRVILAGIVSKGTAANLIFDMHNEYGWDSQSENGTMVKGLRQLFPGSVLVYSIDPKSSRERGVSVDYEVTIGLNEITVADLELLAGEMGFSTAMIDTAQLLQNRFGQEWIKALLERDPISIPDLGQEIGANEASLFALKRKLSNFTEFEFVKPQTDTRLFDELVLNLQRKKHVVLEFGRYTKLRAYMLVANILTRKIHAAFVQQTEQYLRTKDPKDKPFPLMITIEEAHKFLSAEAARHNIFGEIARELRKYSVTLLIVDQRPSGIDTEVMSQIGTRITALLSDQHDIDAVFTGVSGSSELKQILATLESKQQVMILGHAVPMPIVIRTREYGPDFYAALAASVGTVQVEIGTPKQAIKDLFG